MTISLYFVYKWIKAAECDPSNVVAINYWDYFHLLTLTISRAVIIGVKYGTFSDEHFYIMRHVKLTK